MGSELAMRNSEMEAGPLPDLGRIKHAKAWMMRIEEHPSWDVLSLLRVTLRAGVTLHRFRVRDLLGLQVGQVLESLSPAIEDVPLKAGKVQLGWSEFEVLEQRIALRLTRLR